MNVPADFKMRLSEDQRRKVAFMAKREDMTSREWLEREATKAAMTILGETNDLDPKAAGMQLGVSKWTVIRYYNQGLFPDAYQINGRVIRIPQKNVDKMKRDRRLVIE